MLLNRIRTTLRARYLARKYKSPISRVMAVLPLMERYRYMTEEEAFRRACLDYALVEIQFVVMRVVILGQL